MLKAAMLPALLLLAPVLMANTSPTPPVYPGPVMEVDETSAGATVTALYDNDAAAYGRVFRPTLVGSTSEWLTIKIRSVTTMFGGGDTLYMTTPAVTAGGANFSIDTTGFVTTGVATGNETEFKVRFSPQSAGSFSGTVTFTWESDPYQYPGTYVDFRVNVQGSTSAAAVSHLSVHESTPAGTRVFHNQSPANAREFGRRKLAAGPTTALVLWLKNDAPYGAPDLHIGTPVLTTGSAEFTLELSGFAATIAAGAAAEVRVAFDPASVGMHNGVLQFTQDDGVNASPFEVQFLGEGTIEAWQLRVCDNNGPFFDNNPTPPAYTGTHLAENAPAAGNRDLGTVDGGNSATLTLTICNADVGYFAWIGYVPGSDLTLGTPTVQGDADFTVELATYSTTVTSAQTTTLIVRFSPLANGVRSATILIPHMDGSEREPFRVHVTGTGANAGIGGGTGTSDGGGCASGPGSAVGLLLLTLLGLVAASRVVLRTRT
ncbi:MAG: choice-of-anchor D domain-containing protein [Planctomycetes bacterium]|nr:choice-of-anchor D domain-containing protein [Planctomycetota bacterium]